jgi:hypothetical protein
MPTGLSHIGAWRESDPDPTATSVAQLTALLGDPVDRSARHTASRITDPLASKNTL